MLDQLFTRTEARKQLREGPLAEHLEGFCRWLQEQGYSRSVLCRFAAHVSHLSRCLKKRSEGSSIGKIWREAISGIFSRSICPAAAAAWFGAGKSAMSPLR